MTDGPLRRLLGVVRRTAESADGPPADERLLERFAVARDEAAFELLVWRHGAMVLGDTYATSVIDRRTRISYRSLSRLALSSG
jgi:hypothetical protein